MDSARAGTSSTSDVARPTSLAAAERNEQPNQQNGIEQARGKEEG